MKIRTFLLLLLFLSVPFAATGCEREGETPDGTVQDDRNRAAVGREGTTGAFGTETTRITVGRGERSAA